MILTKAQRKALHAVWFRTDKLSYYKFRRAAVVYKDYTMVYFAGMWLGIEKDGYTHS